MNTEPEELVTAIQARVRERRYRLTSHAEREREADQITAREIKQALLSSQCELLENYPDDPRGASCLVLGFTQANAPIHLVCGVARIDEMVIIITVYRPDRDEWIDWRQRREEVR
ncbi:MAG: DUF4258 domain-containing protein [Chloroflexi bacterium]|nr:DUF4258 domain-containing protein [Chloroflexota bacterium]